MFIFLFLARVKACVRINQFSLLWGCVSWDCGWLDEARGVTFLGCPWTIVYRAPKGACFWAVSSVNHDGTLGSIRGWSVICSKGLNVIPKVWTQSWNGCFVSGSGSGVGSKLAGLRGLQGIKERDGSRRCVWRICSRAGDTERKAWWESKFLKE